MVPKRLRSARLRKQLTQEKLGTLIGIDETTARARISQYENGIYNPTFKMVCALAKALDVPECYFYAIDDRIADAILVIYEDLKKN